jgi:selenocysteine-specific elongation factor
VQFHHLADSTFPLHHHTEVKLYLGASETMASVRLLGTEVINPGDIGWLQLDLRNPIVAIRGDRYILRRPSPGETIGGGSVVDPQPRQRHKRFDGAILSALENLSYGSPSEVIMQACLALGPTEAKEAVLRSRLEESIADSAIQELIETGQLMLLDNLLISSSEWWALKKSIVSSLGTFHKESPLRRGMQREELKSRLGLSPQVFNVLINRLESENCILAYSNWIALPDHEVRFSQFQQTKIDQLMDQFALYPYSPPTMKECQEQVGEDVFKRSCFSHNRFPRHGGEGFCKL